MLILCVCLSVYFCPYLSVFLSFRLSVCVRGARGSFPELSKKCTVKIVDPVGRLGVIPDQCRPGIVAAAQVSRYQLARWPLSVTAGVWGKKFCFGL